MKLPKGIEEQIDAVALKFCSLDDVEHINTSGARRLLTKGAQIALECGGWVSVKDRLPKDLQDVFIYPQENKACFLTAFSTSSGINYPTGFYYANVSGNTPIEGVTHWMPLPTPPNED